MFIATYTITHFNPSGLPLFIHYDVASQTNTLGWKVKKTDIKENGFPHDFTLDSSML